MKKRNILPFMVALILLLVVFAIPLQRVKAIGPFLEEDTKGFKIGDNTALVYKIIIIKHRLDLGYTPPYTIGDKFIIQITEANNCISGVVTPSSWISDTLWGDLEYYNSTDKTGQVVAGGLVMAAYNSTDDFTSTSILPTGSYNYYTLGYVLSIFAEGPLLPPIVQDWDAVNHTLYVFILELLNFSLPYISQFHYSVPQRGCADSTAGTWAFWGDGHQYPNAVKFENTFNDNGICTIARLYLNGTYDWDLVWEAKLVSEKPSLPLWLLLTVFYQIPAVDPVFTLGVGLIVAAVVVGVVIIIYILKRQGILSLGV